MGVKNRVRELCEIYDRADENGKEKMSVIIEDYHKKLSEEWIDNNQNTGMSDKDVNKKTRY